MWITKDVAELGSIAIGQQSRGGVGPFRQGWCGLLPALGNQFRNWKPLLGGVDGGRQQFGERFSPIASTQFLPAIDAPRHRPAERPFTGHFRQSTLGEDVTGDCCRGSA